MLVMKATYDNGEIEWMKKPSFSGKHNLIVIFEDLEQDEEKESHCVNEVASNPSWGGFNKLIGSVEARKDGSIRHDDYISGGTES